MVWINGTGQDGTHMLAATKDGKTMVAVNRGSGTVSIFQLTGADPLFAAAWKETIVPVGKAPEGVDRNAEGTQAWVGCAGEIAIVDLSQKKNIDGISTGNLRAARLKFTSDRKYVLGTDGREGVLMFVDAASRTHVHTLSIGCGSEAIFIEPDGQHVLIGVTNEDYVAEVNLESKTVERRITIGKGPDGMAWIGQ